MNRGIWKNGKKKLTGYWEYYWPGGYFIIELDEPDPITNQIRNFRSNEETPEWGKWRLVRKKK
jgi:hypothetical protein